ncbi:VOC family protein [Neobacillus sp. NPDC058068]|uniref:VOC family protein n=1 Tax=Neobacillus sp. NPDC058068 TaxID=3346325 RepID=UPI0036DEA2AD
MPADLSLLKKLNDICLFVPNVEEAVQFYTDKMGFELVRRQPGYVQFDFQGTSLTLWQEDGVYRAIQKEYLGGEGNHFMLAIKVPSLEDVDQLYEELVNRGVECISPPETYQWGSRAVYFRDLNKNIWEIFAWEEGNGPGLL